MACRYLSCGRTSWHGVCPFNSRPIRQLRHFFFSAWSRPVRNLGHCEIQCCDSPVFCNYDSACGHQRHDEDLCLRIQLHHGGSYGNHCIRVRYWFELRNRHHGADRSDGRRHGFGYCRFLWWYGGHNHVHTGWPSLMRRHHGNGRHPRHSNLRSAMKEQL